eukprot:scaffold31512_cov68-Phaeocystis_antarctica.AAC.3
MARRDARGSDGLASKLCMQHSTLRAADRFLGSVATSAGALSAWRGSRAGETRAGRACVAVGSRLRSV